MLLDGSGVSLLFFSHFMGAWCCHGWLCNGLTTALSLTLCIHPCRVQVRQYRLITQLLQALLWFFVDDAAGTASAAGLLLAAVAHPAARPGRGSRATPGSAATAGASNVAAALPLL
jgi:hypothetical protein